MDEELGKCIVCGKKAEVLYPLLDRGPAFCSKHHNPRDAGVFGCDFTGPDDFDIPLDYLYLETPFRRRPKFEQLRLLFVWADKEGDRHPLNTIDDYYLGNIVNFLKRKRTELPPFDGDPVTGEIRDNEQEEDRLDNLIEFLEEEQKYRKKHKR